MSSYLGQVAAPHWLSSDFEVNHSVGLHNFLSCGSEIEMGHGSNGSPFLDGSMGRGSLPLTPLTHDNDINDQ